MTGYLCPDESPLGSVDGYESDEEMEEGVTDEEADDDEPPKLVKKRKLENTETPQIKNGKLTELDKLLIESKKKATKDKGEKAAPGLTNEIKQAEAMKKILEQKKEGKMESGDDSSEDDSDDEDFDDSEVIFTAT